MLQSYHGGKVKNKNLQKTHSRNQKLGIGFTRRNCSLLSITGIPDDCNLNYGMISEEPQCETSSTCATIKVQYSSQGK